MNNPMLAEVRFSTNSTVDAQKYPFCLNVIKNLNTINFPTQVTFFVGENGSGKSTILEAMAFKAGFGLEGGSKNITRITFDDGLYNGVKDLANCMTLSWRLKPRDGYFFKSESFFNIATYIEEIGGNASYGGTSLHKQSHGESFLAFFKNRLNSGGFFIFDEPEAALSPQRQLSLLSIIHELCKGNKSQFIIATHSPLLLAYPGATIYSCDGDFLISTRYEDTDHYKVTKGFLENPRRYLQYLFED